MFGMVAVRLWIHAFGSTEARFCLGSRIGKAVQNAWNGSDESFDNDDLKEVVDFKDVDNESLPVNTWGRFGEYELVGNGKQTSDKCGTWRRFDGCLHVERHAGIVDLNSVNYTGKMYWIKRFYSCDRPECPICFKRGWAVREAKAIEARLAEASKKFGRVEHIIVSVPSADYGLKYERLKAKMIRVLASRGVLGGVLIVHAFRYRNYYEAFAARKPMGWYFSLHAHVLGYVQGGYGRCRSCRKSTLECLSCSGFEGVTRRMFQKEGKRNGSGVGYIVKVKGERKTVCGSAWYQINHCSLVRGDGVRHKEVAIWFGTCGKRKLRLEKGERVSEDICPICCSPLEHIVFVGRAEENPANEFWTRKGFSDYKDDRGVVRWILKDG